MIRSGKLLGKGFALVFIVSAIVVISMMPMLAIAISDGDYAYGLEEEPTIIWQGDVTLIKGTTFSFVPCNNASASYDVNATTDLGALDATGLAFNASDTWYATYGSFYLESIAGIENEVWPNNTWALYINDAMASKGLGANELVDGDNVKFYYCPSDPATYAYLIENASYVVNITVHITESCSVLFDGTVTLTNGTTFSFVPCNNASVSYDVNATTDLCALNATGLAFNASDTWYATYGSFYLESIAGIENEVWPNNTWALYINDAMASKGMGANELVDGDNVKFYFCPSDPATYAYQIENASYLVNITVIIQEVLFDGTVTLTNGTTFTFVPSNNASASYVVSTTTDLGALTATGLAFNASDEWYASYGSFWLDSIAGIENEVWPNSTWCIYINDVAASKGLGGNELKDGDNVKFYFCPANATTYAYITENATYLVNINVSVPPPPTPTPRPHHGGGGAPRDSDHDGYSDVEELLAGTNQNDPNDYPGKPAVAPTPLATPTPSTIVITPTLTPVPAPVTTPTPVPATPTPEEPGFEVVCAIAGLITVAYLVLKRKKG